MLISAVSSASDHQNRPQTCPDCGLLRRKKYSLSGGPATTAQGQSHGYGIL